MKHANEIRRRLIGTRGIEGDEALTAARKRLGAFYSSKPAAILTDADNIKLADWHAAAPAEISAFDAATRGIRAGCSAPLKSGN